MHQFFVFSKSKDRVKIKGEDAHHIAKVLRLKKKERIFVVVGRGERYIGEIQAFEKDGVIVKLVEKIKVKFEPDLPLSVAQSVPKGRKFDEVVKICTELGVKEFFPVISERTLAKVKKEKVERWRRIAKEEAMVSKRDIIPEIHDVLDFHEFIDFYSDKFKTKLIFWELEKDRFLKDIDIIGETIALVGNEGGWSFKEVEMAKQHGFLSVGLGNRILRVEVAPVVITSIILFKTGDLG